MANELRQEDLKTKDLLERIDFTVVSELWVMIPESVSRSIYYPKCSILDVTC